MPGNWIKKESINKQQRGEMLWKSWLGESRKSYKKNKKNKQNQKNKSQNLKK